MIAGKREREGCARAVAVTIGKTRTTAWRDGASVPSIRPIEKYRVLRTAFAIVPPAIADTFRVNPVHGVDG
jgi:hypothetical protein